MPEIFCCCFCFPCAIQCFPISFTPEIHPYEGFHQEKRNKTFFVFALTKYVGRFRVFDQLLTASGVARRQGTNLQVLPGSRSCRCMHRRTANLRRRNRCVKQLLPLRAILFYYYNFSQIKVHTIYQHYLSVELLRCSAVHRFVYQTFKRLIVM